MNTIQKSVLLVGLSALCLSCVWAPYTYSGHWTLAPLAQGGSLSRYVTQGTLHAPLWAAPDRSEVQRATTAASDDWVEDGVVELAAGKLGLWWAAIAAVTLVAVLLFGRRSEGSVAPPTDRPKAKRDPQARRFH